MHNLKPAVAALAALAAGLGGCATKGFVREQVGVVDTRLQGTQAQVSAQQQQLQTHDQRIAGLDQTSREALDRAQAAGKLAEGKFTYLTVLSDDSIKFQTNRAELSSEAQTRLMELANKLKSDNRNVYVEIQGYTDSREARSNRRLGDERAEAVRRFLNQQGIALNRMATISYGDQHAAASNATPGGRAQNRRVVVLVMA
jgi:outer membrane protein OmpA-like peptidoglycan-associated protein